MRGAQRCHDLALAVDGIDGLEPDLGTRSSRPASPCSETWCPRRRSTCPSRPCTTSSARSRRSPAPAANSAARTPSSASRGTKTTSLRFRSRPRARPRRRSRPCSASPRARAGARAPPSSATGRCSTPRGTTSSSPSPSSTAPSRSSTRRLPGEDEEEVVRVRVRVPDELALRLRHLDLRVVVVADDPRAEGLVEARELLGEVDLLQHSVDLRALELAGVVDVDRLPLGVEVERRLCPPRGGRCRCPSCRRTAGAPRRRSCRR